MTRIDGIGPYSPVVFGSNKRRLSAWALAGLGTALLGLTTALAPSQASDKEKEAPKPVMVSELPDLAPDEVLFTRQVSSSMGPLNKALQAQVDKRPALKKAMGTFLAGDLRVKEQQWADWAQPYLVPRLVSLYEADNAGKANISYGTFVEPGQRGLDRGLGASLHVLKYHDETLKDGTEVRTYVNEYWPMNKRDGRLLMPDVIRVRVVAKKKDQSDPMIMTGQFQLLWQDNVDGSVSPSPRAYFYNQHSYDTTLDKETKQNELQTTRDVTINPSSCLKCHNAPAARANPTLEVPKARKKDPELDAILDEAFGSKWREAEAQTGQKRFYPATPLKQHPGYVELIDYLTWRSKLDPKTNKDYELEPISPQFVAAMAEDLLDPKNFRVPNIVPVLQEWQKGKRFFPWAEGDVEVGGHNQAGRQTLTPYRLTMQKRGDAPLGQQYERAGYHMLDYYQLGLGTWWFPETHTTMLPKHRPQK